MEYIFDWDNSEDFTDNAIFFIKLTSVREFTRERVREINRHRPNLIAELANNNSLLN
jgi:hypothetical protein